MCCGVSRLGDSGVSRLGDTSAFVKGALYRIQILCRRYTFWSYPAGLTIADPPASFFFGVRIWLVKVLGQFSINYFRGLGLRIRVRIWVRVRV